LLREKTRNQARHRWVCAQDPQYIRLRIKRKSGKETKKRRRWERISICICCICMYMHGKYEKNRERMDNTSGIEVVVKHSMRSHGKKEIPPWSKELFSEMIHPLYYIISGITILQFWNYNSTNNLI
jgi:hypothetical protein